MVHYLTAALALFSAVLLPVASAQPVRVAADVISLFSDSDVQMAALARVAAAMVAADPTFDAISLQLRTLPVGPRSIDALLEVCNAVEGLSIAAIVGPTFSRQAVPVGGWSAATGVPVVSHAATAPSLGDASNYPYVFRTCPSDTLLAAALLDALVASGVSRFTIVAQNDEYGLGGLSALQQLAPARGLEVAGVLTFAWQATQASIDAAVASLAAADARIIVVWATDSQTEALLRAARARGLVGPTHAWLLSTPVLMGDPTDPQGDVFIGLVSVDAAPPRSYGSARLNFTAVLQRWQALEPATFPPDGQIDVYAVYAYDTVLAVATAIREAVRGGWRPRIFSNGSCFGLQPPGANEVAISAALRLITVEGLTGTISWSAAGADRVLSRVSLQNLVRIPSDAGGAYRRGYVEAALWTPSTPLTPDAPGAASTDARGAFSPIKPLLYWPGGSTSPPPERDVLRGRTLRVVTLHAPPFVFVDSVSPLRLRGVAIEVLNDLSASLGFVINVTVSNRSYSALVDAVAAGEFDFLAADITVNARRQKIVKLSVPWFEDGLRVAIRRAEPVAVVSLGSFLQPFTWRVWVTVLLVMVLGGIIFFMIEHRSNPALAGPSSDPTGNPAWTHVARGKLLSVGILHVASSFTGADTGISPTTTPGRLLMLGFTFLWLILVSSFTGSVAAALSAQRADRSITGFDDIKRGEVAPNRVGAAIGSNTFTVFTQEVGAAPQGFASLTAVLEALSASDVDAAVGVGTSLRYNIGQSFCDLQVVGADWYKSALAYAFPLGFPFAAELDQGILQLKESGATYRIYESYLVSSCDARDTTSVNALDLEDLAGVFLICFFVVAAATTMWACSSYARGECPRLEAVVMRLLPFACLRRRRLGLGPHQQQQKQRQSTVTPTGHTALSSRKPSAAATANPAGGPLSTAGSSSNLNVQNPLSATAAPTASGSAASTPTATSSAVAAATHAPATRRGTGLTAAEWGSGLELPLTRDPHSRGGRAARLLSAAPTPTPTP